MANIESEIRGLLVQTAEPGSSNTISVEYVRGWLNGLLDDYAEEFADRTEKLVSAPLWDLVAADTNPQCDALFVAVVIHGNEVRLVSGRGGSNEVRRFGDSEFPSDISLLPQELKRRFATTSAPLVLSRDDVEVWLGRR